MSNTDQRDFKRIQFSVKTEIEHRDKVNSGELLDISLKGAFMTFPGGLSLSKGEECVLRIYLPSSEVILTFDSKLIHVQNHNYGFQFVGVDDVTLGHLRRLLELHLGDEREVEHELFFLLFPPVEKE